MINETEEQGDVETEYFEQSQPGKEETGKPLHSHGKDIEQRTSTELLDAQANDQEYTQASLSSGVPKSTFVFDTEDILLLPHK